VQAWSDLEKKHKNNEVQNKGRGAEVTAKQGELFYSTGEKRGARRDRNSWNSLSFNLSVHARHVIFPHLLSFCLLVCTGKRLLKTWKGGGWVVGRWGLVPQYDWLYGILWSCWHGS
jgi:hypothetical protein